MEGLVLHNFIKNRLKQRGAALVEYAVLLSFVCAVGWSFVGSNNGMTGSIGSIIHSVERLLGMNGVVNVDDGNWINFEGKLSGDLTLNGKKATGTEMLSEGNVIKLFFSDETFEKKGKKGIINL